MTGHGVVHWVPRGLVAVAVALAVTGAGCGGSSSARDRLAAALETTQAEKTAQVAISAAVSGSGADSSFEGEGAFDFTDGRGVLVLQGGGAGEVRFAGPVVFVKLDQLARPWLRIDTEALRAQPGVDADSLAQLRRNNPVAVLSYLRGVTDDVEEVGQETVRGEATTRYKTTIDLDQAAEGADAEARRDIRRIVRELGTSRLPVEAWIDGAGRLRRLRYTLDVADLDTGATRASGRITASFELFQFGRKVDVSDPPADQTTDLSDVVRAQPPAG